CAGPARRKATAPPSRSRPPAPASEGAACQYHWRSASHTHRRRRTTVACLRPIPRYAAKRQGMDRAPRDTSRSAYPQEPAPWRSRHRTGGLPSRLPDRSGRTPSSILRFHVAALVRPLLGLLLGLGLLSRLIGYQIGVPESLQQPAILPRRLKLVANIYPLTAIGQGPLRYVLHRCLPKEGRPKPPLLATTWVSRRHQQPEPQGHTQRP